MTGYVSVSHPEEVIWSLRVECREARFRNDTEKTAEQLAEQKEYAEFLTSCDCFADISSLSFPISNWRELSGQTLEFSHPESELLPIMPDLDSVFYFDSQHHATINNRLSIGARKGCIFKLSWKFDAMESEDDIVGGIELETTVALREFYVAEDTLTENSKARAIEIVSQFADREDIDIARVRPGKQCFIVPIRADVE